MSSDTDETTDVTNDTVDIRDQLTQACDEMTYPIELPSDLSAGFRSWDNTSFGGQAELTSARLQVVLDDDPAAFPYDSVDELVAELLDKLDAHGYLTYDENEDTYHVVE